MKKKIESQADQRAYIDDFVRRFADHSDAHIQETRKVAAAYLNATRHLERATETFGSNPTIDNMRNLVTAVELEAEATYAVGAFLWRYTTGTTRLVSGLCLLCAKLTKGQKVRKSRRILKREEAYIARQGVAS